MLNVMLNCINQMSQPDQLNALTELTIFYEVVMSATSQWIKYH